MRILGNFPSCLAGPIYLLALSLTAVTGASHVSAQSTPRVPVERASTEQKAKFVENLVTRSVTAQTIESSDDDAAIRKLADARALVKQAKAALAGGQPEDANRKLDAALRLVNVEARRLSQDSLKGERRREEYDRRLHSVRTFLSAYERVAQDKELSAAAAAQMTKIRDLTRTAEGHAQEGLLEEANDTLALAYRLARGDIREMREGQTLTRSLDFATPEDEYKYEHDRNDSHVVLLQFAIEEKSPPASRRKRIDQLLSEAMAIRAEAETEAQAGKHSSAIEVIVRSTDTLLKAIRMSGVWVPG